MNMSVTENATLSTLPKYQRLGFVRRIQEARP